MLPEGTIYGDNFAVDTGYLNYASSNNLIILMPQIVATVPNNAFGCWDFFGYTGPDFWNNKGVQPRAIKAMVERLIGKQVPADNILII